MEVLFLSILLNKFVRLYKILIQRSIIEKSDLEAQYQWSAIAWYWWISTWERAPKAVLTLQSIKSYLALIEYVRCRSFERPVVESEDSFKWTIANMFCNICSWWISFESETNPKPITPEQFQCGCLSGRTNHGIFQIKDLFLSKFTRLNSVK